MSLVWGFLSLTWLPSPDPCWSVERDKFMLCRWHLSLHPCVPEIRYGHYLSGFWLLCTHGITICNSGSHFRPPTNSILSLSFILHHHLHSLSTSNQGHFWNLFFNFVQLDAGGLVYVCCWVQSHCSQQAEKHCPSAETFYVRLIFYRFEYYKRLFRWFRIRQYMLKAVLD